MCVHTNVKLPGPCMSVVQDKVISFLDELSNDALKKEATSEAKSDTFSSIMKVKYNMSYLYTWNN